jgi:prepilin-type N-terminal cleavage/methylation domain-containing protein
MRRKNAHFLISNKKGFTLVELLVTVGIMAVLASIGFKYYQNSRKMGFDAQVVSLMRNLLTYAAVDEPVGEQDSTAADPSDLTPVGYDNVKVGVRIEYQIVNADGSGADPGDAWQFWFAHPGGRTGYYFWIPGDACSDTKDGSGIPSDAIQQDPAYRAVVGL